MQYYTVWYCMILYDTVLFWTILWSCSWVNVKVDLFYPKWNQHGGLCIDVESWYRVSTGSGLLGILYVQNDREWSIKSWNSASRRVTPEPRIHQPSAAKVASKLSRRSTDASTGELIHWNITKGNNTNCGINNKSKPKGTSPKLYWNIHYQSNKSNLMLF